MIAKNREFKEAAYLAYTKAIRSGLLKRPDECSRCGGKRDIQGHHVDYAKPFFVVWLCRTCHGREHAGDMRSRRVPVIDGREQRGVVIPVGAKPCASCGGSGRAASPRPLTAVQRDLYEYIWRYVREHGYAPSFDEIAAARGYSTGSTVHEHLRNLEEKFWISRQYNEARAIRCLVDLSAEKVA